MDVLNKHVEQISFRQCVTFCEHRQLKGWQPHFQPTVAKSSISTMVHYGSLVCRSHMSQVRAQSISCRPNLGHNHCIGRNKSWRPQLRDQTLCFSACFFLKLKQRDGIFCNHDARILSWWSVLPLSGTSSFC